MFQRIIDDFRDRAGGAVQLMSFAAAAALALLVTISFLCAAVFVWVLDSYGLVQACLAGAGVFLVVAVVALVCFAVRKKKLEAHAAEPTKSAVHSALSDPMVVAVGLQLVRAIGFKKLIPILAVGGLALGLLASRNSTTTDQAPAE